MTPKKTPKAFTSFRVMGKKAQKIIERARNGMQRETKKPAAKIPKGEKFQEVVMHLSVRSVVRGTFVILAIVAGAWIVFHLRDKIILLLLAVFVATVVDPGVRTLEKYRIPRGVAVLIHYFIAIFLFFFLLFSLIPIIAAQLQQMAVFLSAEVDTFLIDPQISLPLITWEMNQRLTVMAQSTVQNLSIDQLADAMQQLGQNLSTAASGSVRFAAQVAGSVVNFFISFILVLVLAFFMQLEKEKIIRWSRGFLPTRLQLYFDSKQEAIHLKIGQWARGELMLMISIAVLTFIALNILRMPYALTLAVLAGFCELIPVIGPFFAAIPAVLIALVQKDFIWALVVAGVYYVIQWCENNLLVPLIMKRAVGLSPIAILFAMMVGISFPETIHPVLGVILAIPTTTIIALFLDDGRLKNRH